MKPIETRADLKKHSENSVTRSLWIILAALIGFQVLAPSLNYSFFFDGGIYAGLARNLAEGLGSMWSLHFSKTLFPVFSEHPPLMMWIQAIGFAIFGDTILVEKTFSFATCMLSGILLFKIWTNLNVGDQIVRQAAPLTLAFTLIAGRLNWSFYNGMLENLLIVFSLIATLSVIIAYQADQSITRHKRLLLILCAGVAICGATLTKGPVGLFPLAAPAIYWLTIRTVKFHIVVIDSLLLVSIISAFILLLWSFDAPREAMQRYLTSQLASSMSGERGTHGGGFYILRKILGVNGYSLLYLAAVVVIARLCSLTPQDKSLRSIRLKRAAFMLVVGLSASLPIALSARVVNHYLNPSLPFYTAGICILAAPFAMTALQAMSNRSKHWIKVLSFVLLICSFAYSAFNFQRGGTDDQTIDNAAKIAAVVCDASKTCDVTISVCGDLWSDWALHTYLQRYYKISLAKADLVDTTYLLADQNCPSTQSHTDTGSGTVSYRLLKK